MINRRQLQLGLLGAGLSPLLGSCDPEKPPPKPYPGQWINYGSSEPPINGNSFNFPTDSNHVAGYFITSPPQVAPGLLVTLNYDITGFNPVWQQHVQPDGSHDDPPASLTLFLWRQGDTLLGDKASYRFWYPQRNLLQLGQGQVLSGRLDSNVWTNVAGLHDPNGFLLALQNNLGLGFTFGGAKFYGHGVYLSSGNATFKINSFTVQ
jgi:hypothetical protein